MGEVKAIRIGDDQFIYVEVDNTLDESKLPKSTAVSSYQPRLPEGAKPVGVVDDAIDALKSMQQQITTLAKTVNDSFSAHQPEEWSLELNFGFKGKSSPIPVLLSGEASGSVKVTAKWKKTSAS